MKSFPINKIFQVVGSALIISVLFSSAQAIPTVCMVQEKSVPNVFKALTEREAKSKLNKNGKTVLKHNESMEVSPESSYIRVLFNNRSAQRAYTVFVRNQVAKEKMDRTLLLADSKTEAQQIIDNFKGKEGASDIPRLLELDESDIQSLVKNCQ